MRPVPHCLLSSSLFLKNQRGLSSDIPQSTTGNCRQRLVTQYITRLILGQRALVHLRLETNIIGDILRSSRFSQDSHNIYSKVIQGINWAIFLGTNYCSRWGIQSYITPSSKCGYSERSSPTDSELFPRIKYCSYLFGFPRVSETRVLFSVLEMSPR